jgi:hypothetical protein
MAEMTRAVCNFSCGAAANLLYPLSMKSLAMGLKQMGFDALERVPGTRVRGFAGLRILGNRPPS